MTEQSLATLDQQRVVVQLTIDDRLVNVCGTCKYEADPDLGKVLRITVKDPTGSFHMLLQESDWKGEIGHDAERKLPLIRLDTNILSPP